MSDEYQTPLSPGDRLDRYELICPIASGGMASVWVARLRGKHGFEKLVAIKTILPQYASDARFRNMFLDEARILSQIHHVNVAQILDVGEEHSVLYLVMEFVDGDSLSKVLKPVLTQSQAVPSGVLMRILADACVGLHAAHELREKSTGSLVGLVHRDVSPQNVLITQQGATKLIDFGIAKAKGRLAQETNAGGIKGKISFMAPEQASGKSLDRRADVWAVGAILYAAYARRTPYEGETELDTLHALVNGRDPEPLGSDAPKPIRDLASRATRANPEARFATALELSRAFESAMAELGMLTSQADVAVYMGTNLKDRAASRQKALTFALKAADDRDRVREMLTPDSVEDSSDEGLYGAHQRMKAAQLDDSIPPAKLPDEEKARVRVGGTIAYEDANLGHARTAFKSGSPPPLDVLTNDSSDLETDESMSGRPARVNTKLASGIAPKPGRPPSVPDLIVAPELPKPPPKPPPAPPKPERASEPSFRPPPPRIASAAGSIIGPDVLGPNAGKLPPPPMPGEDPPHSGEFLDPMAIAAKRSAAPQERSPRASSYSRNDDRGDTNDMMSSARPVRAIVVDTQAELRRARSPGERPRTRLRAAIGAAAALLVLFGIAVVVAPGCAKRQAIAAAEQQGVTLAVERATVGWGTVHLYGLSFSAADVPAIKMTASEAAIDLHFLDADTIALQEPQISFEGTADEVESALGKLRARASTGTGKARQVSLQNARITWNGPIGAGSRVDADGVGLELVRGASGLGDEAHFTSPNTRFLTARGALGPWRVDADRTNKQARMRIGFDPVLADGPSASFIRTENGTTATIKIARQPLPRLGVPYAFLGLAADDQTQVEATIQVTRPLPNRVVGDATVTLYDARLTPLAPRMDVVLKGGFAGEPGAPLETTRTQLSFGPLVAHVIGAVTLFDESMRIDLKWTVPPLPCGVLTKKTSPNQASAAGLVTFDSRRPDQAEFRLTQASTCGLPIFPAF